MTLNQEWLVEIRVRDWVAVPDGQSRIVAFEEVAAANEVGARHKAFEQFERRYQHEPSMRLKMHGLGVALHECCAPDAVQVS